MIREVKEGEEFKKIKTLKKVDGKMVSDQSRYDNLPSWYAVKEIGDVFAEQKPTRVAFVTYARSDSNTSEFIDMQRKAYAAASDAGATMDVLSAGDLGNVLKSLWRGNMESDQAYEARVDKELVQRFKQYDTVVLAVAGCYDCAFAGKGDDKETNDLKSLHKAVGERVYMMTNRPVDKMSCGDKADRLQEKMLGVGYVLSDFFVK